MPDEPTGTDIHSRLAAGEKLRSGIKPLAQLRSNNKFLERLFPGVADAFFTAPPLSSSPLRRQTSVRRIFINRFKLRGFAWNVRLHGYAYEPTRGTGAYGMDLEAAVP